MKFFFLLLLSSLINSCIVLNFYVDEDLQSKEEVTPPPNEEEKKREWEERQEWKSRKPSWVLVPGWYRSHDKGSEGFELSVLKNHTGLVFGVQDDILKYAEIEYASLFTLSFGLRKREDGKIATQATWSAPWFIVFPYGRKIWNDPGRNYEVGMMIKIPLGDFSVKKRDPGTTPRTRGNTKI